MIALFAGFLADIVISGADLPYTFEHEVPGPGNVKVVVVEAPNNFNFVADFPDLQAGSSHSQAGEARVSKSPVKIVVRDAYGAKIEGAIKLKVNFFEESDKSEPNDDAAHARKIEAGDVMLGIFPRGERDVLALNVPGGGYVLCTVENPPQGLTPVCDIRDSLDFKRGVNSARFDHADTAFIILSDAYNGFSSQSQFKLRVEFVPEVDLFEPNDTPPFATRIELNTWYNAACAPGSDIDYFRVTAPEKGFLIVETSTPPVQIKWELRGEDGGTLSSFNPFAVEKGERLLAMSSVYGQFKIENFMFIVRFEAAGSVTSSNNEKPLAVSAGNRYRLLLLGNAPVNLNVVSEKPGIVTLRAADRSPEGLLFAAKVGEIDYRVCPIAIRVKAGSTPVSFYAQYQGGPSIVYIEVGTEPELDENEPNDTMSEARAVKFGEDVTVMAYPAWDADWFSFDVPEPGYIYAVLHSGYVAMYNAGYRIDVAVFDSEGKQIAATKQYGSEIDRAVRVEKKGKYFVRVGCNQFPSLEKFCMTVDFLADTAKSFDAEKGGIMMYFIGVELDQSGGTALKLVAKTSHGGFLEAAKADEIPMRVEEAYAKATAEKPVEKPPEVKPNVAVAEPEESGTKWWLYSILGVLVVAALARVLKRS